MAAARNRLEGDLTTAQREHNAAIKAMERNEAKLKKELEAKEVHP